MAVSTLLFVAVAGFVAHPLPVSSVARPSSNIILSDNLDALSPQPSPPPEDQDASAEEILPPKCTYPGCDGQGRVLGGLAAIDAFAWWPIKVSLQQQYLPNLHTKTNPVLITAGIPALS